MRRPLILIADDNLDTREMYALYLNMVGYNVETAEQLAREVSDRLSVRRKSAASAL